MYLDCYSNSAVSIGSKITINFAKQQEHPGYETQIEWSMFHVDISPTVQSDATRFTGLILVNRCVNANMCMCNGFPACAWL